MEDVYTQQDPRLAARLRKQLHQACHGSELQTLRDRLHELYENEDTPLGSSKEEVGHPASFAALLEVALLARTLAHIDATNARSMLALEMWNNVETLHSGFGVSDEQMVAVRLAYDECGTAPDLAAAQAACDAHFAEEHSLHKKIRLERHVPRGR